MDFWPNHWFMRRNGIYFYITLLAFGCRFEDTFLSSNLQPKANWLPIFAFLPSVASITSKLVCVVLDFAVHSFVPLERRGHINSSACFGNGLCVKATQFKAVEFCRHFAVVLSNAQTARRLTNYKANSFSFKF